MFTSAQTSEPSDALACVDKVTLASFSICAMAVSATHTVSTDSLRRYLFAISQYCRSVSEQTHEDKFPPTAFHSVIEPPVELSDYIVGIGRRLRLGRVTVLLAAVFVARTAQRLGRAPSILSIHRHFAAALLLAAKVRGDVQTLSDSTFATNAGLPASEVSELLHVYQSLNELDINDYAADMQLMQERLDTACKTSLRSDITTAVARAFGLPFESSVSSALRRSSFQRTPVELAKAMRSTSTFLPNDVAMSEMYDERSAPNESHDSSFVGTSGTTAVVELSGSDLREPITPWLPTRGTSWMNSSCALATFAPLFGASAE